MFYSCLSKTIKWLLPADTALSRIFILVSVASLWMWLSRFSDDSKSSGDPYYKTFLNAN
jgi:hypothetical protein